MRDLPGIVRETMIRHSMISEGNLVILGLSGGPDSLCLFHVLNTLKKELGFSLTCVHVNHMLRGDESEEDQRFVEKLCEKFGVRCDVYRIDCEKMASEWMMTVEEAGRKARYDSFMESADSSDMPAGRVKVAVAQNMDDQAETILFRIIRGTGIDGLCGMEYKRSDVRGYTVIRPLLDVERGDIEDYCRVQGLDPRIDSTNQETEYTRNRIRLGLLPYIKGEFNGRIVETVSRMGNILRSDRDFLESSAGEAAQKLSQKENGHTGYSRQGLSSLDRAVSSRIIRNEMKKKGLVQDIMAKHIEAAEDLLQGGAASGSVDFPGGYRFCVSYDLAFVLGPEEKSDVRAELPKLKISIVSPDEKENSGCRFDADSMAEKLGIEKNEDMLSSIGALIHLRTRRKGDFIALKNGRKKIQDLFVDDKVPRDQRDLIPLCAIDNEVLWIPSGGGKKRYSAVCPVTETTQHVLALEIEE